MIIQFVLARILTSKHSLTNLRNYIDTKGQRTYKIVKRQTNPFNTSETKKIQRAVQINPKGGVIISRRRSKYI